MRPFATAVRARQFDGGIVFRGEQGQESLFVLSSPEDQAESDEDHRFLQSLWENGTTKTHGPVVCSARFSLCASQSDDSCNALGTSSIATEDVVRLQSLLRRRLFGKWRSLFPAVTKVTGSFEVFNPSNGTNMGWHQDGYGPGMMIAHYALLGAGDTGTAMNWFEVALPPSLHHNEAEAEEMACYSVDVRRVDRSNFLAFEFTPAARQPLVIIEDAAAFHRTPLTAHSIHDLQRAKRRPIARIVFYAVAAAAESAVGVAEEFCASESPALVPPLPNGLLAVVERFAATQSEKPTSVDDALDRYVAGDTELVGWLVNLKLEGDDCCENARRI
jgi:hypothetical protein